MTVFTYIARTPAGTLERGSIEAGSAEDAREQLRKQQLMVEELQQQHKKAAVGFAGVSMPWTTTEQDLPAETAAPSAVATSEDYIPLVDTLRLFAGWLLAWYGLVYLLGSYKLSGKLTVDIPFLQSLFESGLVLRFAFGTFLFLLLTTIHTWLGKGIGKGLLLAAAWIALMVCFHFLA